MRRSLMVLALLLQACEKPLPPAKMRARPLPPAGILRVSHSSTSAAEVLGEKSMTGYPGVVFRMEYAGPKIRIELNGEAWHRGKRLTTGKSSYSLRLPLSGDVAFGFSDGTTSEGKPAIVVRETLRLATPAGGNADVLGETTAVPMPSLKGRAFRIVEPVLPDDVPDGKEAVWLVVVDEPADVPLTAPAEERVKRAEAAWIFRIRTADEKK